MTLTDRRLEPNTDSFLVPDDYDSAWKDQAACRDVHPDLFFLERGASSREAQEICSSCPVWADCLDYATWIIRASDGIWAGTAERTRRALRMGRISIDDVEREVRG